MTIKNIINKNKIDIIYIILILIFTVICYNLFYQNIYSPFSDIGREFYVPEQIKNGEILYKDILNVYAPLSYWINAIIIKFFGNNFNVFTTISLAISILTLIPIFLISKIYTNKHIAFLITLLITSTCAFYPSISNWITPYSYAITYALCAITWCIYCIIKNADTNNANYLFLASILAGISVCCKYEYTLIILIILVQAIFSKKNIKNILGIFIAPITCFIILIIQGCNLNDFIQAINHIVELSKSESVKFFYNFAGISITNATINNIIKNLIQVNLKTLFYSIIFINLLFLIYSIQIKNKKLIMLLSIGLLASIKTIGGISLEIYGTYFLPLLIIGLTASIYDNPNKGKNIIIGLIATCLIYTYFSYTIQETKKLIPLHTQKGIIKIPLIFYNTTNEIKDYLNTKTEATSKILILPEGVILNYLTNKKSENYLYYLIPPNKEILGIEFIKNKIKEKNIEYILITNIQYPWYNATSFSNDWGKEITEYIKNEYKYETTIGKDFQFYVYKRDIIK